MSLRVFRHMCVCAFLPQIITVNIYDAARWDLQAAWAAAKVNDAIIEFKLLIVQSVNTLVPDSEDDGLAVVVRITEQGRTIPIDRIGELTASLIAVAACVGAVLLTWLVYQYRKAQEQRRYEEHHRLVSRAAQEAEYDSENDSPDEASKKLFKRTQSSVTFVKHNGTGR